MKLRLEATPEELQSKSAELIKALSEMLPELAESLEKALPRKEPELKYPVLRELQKKTVEAYEKTMLAMVKAVGKVLDRGPIAKSEQVTVMFKGSAATTVPCVHSGELQKAEPKAEPLKNDHTKPIADKDDVAYKRVKKVLVGKGFLESDFDEGGAFYGWSVNQLIDYARGKED